MYVEVRGYLAGVGYLLPSCGFRGSDSCGQAWWQASLTTEQSHQPYAVISFISKDFIYLFYSICVSVFTQCVYLCTACVPGACEGQQRTADTLELEMAVASIRCWELNLGPLQDRPVLLITGPSLRHCQPRTYVFHFLSATGLCPHKQG